MFCPQCGSRRASADVVYCSNCGFPLGGVQQLLANNGALPSALKAADEGKPHSRLDLVLNGGDSGATRFSPRRRGINHGLLLWMIGAVLVPLSVVLTQTLELGPALTVTLAILLFVGGLMRMLYALLIQEGGRQTDKRMTDENSSPIYTPPIVAPPSALPASSAKSIPSFKHRTTAELVQPASVTDHTTRLLEMQETEVRRRRTE